MKTNKELKYALAIEAVYDIGETVYFKCLRGKEPEYIQGEIVRISV